MAELGGLTTSRPCSPRRRPPSRARRGAAPPLSRAARVSAASSYVTVTCCFFLSAAAVLTPFRSFSADSVRTAHPAQCHPDTFKVSVFGAAKAAVESPAARATAAMSLFMSLLDISRPGCIQSECPAGIRGRDALDLRERRLPQLGKPGGGKCYIGGVVPLPAVRHGREEGTIRLDEEPFEGDPPRGVPQGVRGLEGEDAAQADVEPEREVPLRRPPVAREALHHPGLLPHLLREKRRGVVVRLASVDDDGLSQPPGEADLLGEPLPLHLSRRSVVVVVEPALSHRHHS